MIPNNKPDVLFTNTTEKKAKLIDISLILDEIIAKATSQIRKIQN
jgi:hypothetical protein